MTSSTSIAAVTPAKLLNYLRTRGWRRTAEEEHRWSAWSPVDSDSEVVVLLDMSFRDYQRRVTDALSNLANSPATLTNPTDTDGKPDGIRLLQAWRTNDANAKPIVPVNKRFAENTVKTGPASGNPMLYRASTGHKGIFCEACHGSTHSIWPAANPNANDNVAANQAQGHTGKIVECATCHTGSLGNTLEGPHGMHPVGSAGLDFADGGHEKLAERNANECRACHGSNGQGTVLSKVAVDRSFTIGECEKGSLCPGGKAKNFTVNLKKGDIISCTLCHDNKLK